MNGSSPLHRLDPRVQLILLLSFIAALSLWPRVSLARFAGCVLVMAILFALSGAPVARSLRDALLLLPFVGLFAAILYLSGDSGRALAILQKCYLSGLAVILVRATTPLPRLMAAAQFFRIPALLIQTMQLTFRYLAVLKSEASAMQTAMAARGGRVRKRALLASAGAVAVLFLSSLERSDRIFHAMVSRGFSQHLPAASFARPKPVDYVVLLAGLSAVGATLLLR